MSFFSHRMKMKMGRHNGGDIFFHHKPPTDLPPEYILPVITIAPYETSPTNQDIIVYASVDKGALNVTSHTFTENGSFQFIVTDAGFSTSIVVTIINIDKIPPVITVGSYSTVITNQNVTVTATTNKGTLNVDSHTFTTNDSFEFVAIDAAGNSSSTIVTIENIDKTAPSVPVALADITGLTNQNVIVSATFSADSVIKQFSKNGGVWTNYTSGIVFTANEDVKFKSRDEAGNWSVETIYTVSNIDKVAPVITIDPYNTNLTNQNVTVTASTNKGTLNFTSHTFTTNGFFDFIATDAAGNVTTQRVTLSNIDKVAPVIAINPYTTEITNQDILVTASVNKGTLNAESHLFTVNGSFEFVATDLAGNSSSQVVTITNIDKVVPVITINTYNTNPTNQDITVTASTNKGTLNALSHTFTANGSFTFVATDGELVTSETVIITNIDKVAPTITVNPYNTNPTNQNITVVASTNEGTLNFESHTFTTNGSFDFVATDPAGNVTTETVTVANIDKVAPTITIDPYTLTPVNTNITVYASTNKGTLNFASHTFVANGSFDFVATDPAGNATTQRVTISNIDKVPPVITIDPYNTAPTNQNITVTASTNEGTLNFTSHTFTINGSFDFVATDGAGNITTQSVVISNIDKVAPIITIDPYNTNPTNQDITVTASANKGTLNFASHVFATNGFFDFVATDAAGNITTQRVTISNIDKVAPTVTIDPYNTNPTNQNIAVTASINKGSLNEISHLFTANGFFDFVATDAAGNVTTQRVTISNIDKVAPIITIDPYNTNQTNQDIVVTASTNEGTLNETSYTFTANGSFTFVATDSAGNTTSQMITITNIDKALPVAPTISADVTAPTNANVTATISYSGDSVIRQYRKDGGVWTNYTVPIAFTVNGTLEAKGQDAVGNWSATTVYNVTNIDKVAPVITIAPYTTAPTNQNITVNASVNEGTLNVTSHLFTANDSFEFTATDPAGNSASTTVTITNIDKVAPIITIDPYNTEPTDQDIVVTASTNEGTLNATSHTFTANGSFTFTATDAAGNVTNTMVTITNITVPSVDLILPDYLQAVNCRMAINIDEQVKDLFDPNDLLSTPLVDLSAEIGKNLFDGFLESGIYNSTGYKSSFSACVRSGAKLKVDASTEYTLSLSGDLTKVFVVCFYGVYGGFLSQVSSVNTFTTPSNCNYITFYFTSTDTDSPIQFELGPIVTVYELNLFSNVHLLNFSSTEASGYAALPLPNGKYPYFLKFDGINDCCLGRKNSEELNILETNDFIYSLVVRTTNTIGYSFIFAKSLSGNATVQYGLQLAPADLQIYLNGVNNSAPFTLLINTLYAIVVSRIAGILKVTINGVEIYNQPNTQDLISQPHFIVGAESSNNDGTARMQFTNHYLGNLAIFYNGATGLNETAVLEAIAEFNKNYV